MDVDSVEPGEDFVAVIEQALQSCQVLIVLIGKLPVELAQQPC